MYIKLIYWIFFFDQIYWIFLITFKNILYPKNKISTCFFMRKFVHVWLYKKKLKNCVIEAIHTNQSIKVTTSAILYESMFLVYPIVFTWPWAVHIISSKYCYSKTMRHRLKTCSYLLTPSKQILTLAISSFPQSLHSVTDFHPHQTS